MKYENIRNPIDKDITLIELSEKELEYIALLRLEVNIKKLKDSFVMSTAELNKLYRKFGIWDNFSNRDKHLLTISLINNITPYNILEKVVKKYNLTECQKLLEAIKNAKHYDDEFFADINEKLIDIYKKISDTFMQ